MKNILLQHYEGPLSDVAKISIRQMQQYAEFCGAEYKLLTGKPFTDKITFTGKKPLCNQKVAMINEEFDEYDTVVMVDPDMVMVKGLKDNIFTDETGIGICTDHIRKNAWSRIQNAFPKWTSGEHLFCSGSIWRIDRELRQKLRAEIVDAEVKRIGSTIFVDEGIMHRLFVRCDVRAKRKNILPQKWSYCSYLPNCKENGALIHLRKTPPGKIGPNVEKLDSYYRLLKDSEIEE